jgi:hypothetical protein
VCMLCSHQVSGTSILTDSDAVLKSHSVSECDRMRMLGCTFGHSRSIVTEWSTSHPATQSSCWYTDTTGAQPAPVTFTSH